LLKSGIGLGNRGLVHNCHTAPAEGLIKKIRNFSRALRAVGRLFG
jgi:hypothetical protein